MPAIAPTLTWFSFSVRGRRWRAALVIANCARCFRAAHILGCSTGGQINNDDVNDDEIAAAAIGFDATRLRVACEPACSPESSRARGDAIGRALAATDLVGIFVLSDGLNVNGSELVAGITGAVGEAVAVTGGLAGDGADFQRNTCRRRLRTAQTFGRGGWLLRSGDPYRPR